MTNKEASNVLRLFANLIEINGLPEERILTFRKAYEQAISELESDTIPQGEWIEHERNYDSHSHRMFFSCECSICHMYEDFPQDDETGNVLTSHYCKYCGSNMWKETDNETD